MLSSQRKWREHNIGILNPGIDIFPLFYSLLLENWFSDGHNYGFFLQFTSTLHKGHRVALCELIYYLKHDQAFHRYLKHQTLPDLSRDLKLTAIRNVHYKKLT